MSLNPHVLSYRIRKRDHTVNHHSSDAVHVKRPVMLLRGLGRSSRFWLQFEEELAKHADAIYIDLLGTGQSKHPKGHLSVEAHAADVIHTLHEIHNDNSEQAKGIGFPLHQLAISFGGMVSLKVSEGLEKSVHEVLSAVVISTSARFTKEKRINPFAAASLLASLRFKEPKNEKFAHHLVSNAHLDSDPTLPEQWNRLYREEGFNKVATLRQLAAAALFHGKSCVTNISHPLLFVASESDSLVGWRNSKVLSETAKKGDYLGFASYGHDIPTEIPEELAFRVAGFFAKHEV